MAGTEGMIVAKSESGPILQFQLKDVPVQFVNAIRRILLNETPTVEIQDVQILTNTSPSGTVMPHEMLRHRVEMLPVNVRPTETEIIMKTKIELRIGQEDKDVHNITTDDFVVQSDRPDILLKDRDLGTPLFVHRIHKNDSIHIVGRLGVNPNGSQVCTATYGFHIDPERAEEMKAEFLAKNPGLADAEKIFTNSTIQRAYSINDKGRPNWFDVTVETLGIIPSRELVRQSAKSLRERTKRWSDSVRDSIIRSSEEGVYTFVSSEGHTLGALLQYLLYDSNLVTIVDYDIPHPLRQEMRLRVQTNRRPEEILDYCVAQVTDLCTRLENEI
jgi:DNA-directed RNA polymerase subunit L